MAFPHNLINDDDEFLNYKAIPFFQISFLCLVILQAFSHDLYLRVLILLREEVRAHVRNLSVDRDAIVVEARGLKDDAGSADAHSQGENPQKQPVQDHGNVLPIFFNLESMCEIGLVPDVVIKDTFMAILNWFMNHLSYLCGFFSLFGVFCNKVDARA